MRAAVELLQRVPLVSPTTIADLGCGAGDVTRLIANHWPSATVIGVDSSQEMLEPARADNPDITWISTTIEQWVPDKQFDLIYSNAALHWVKGHEHIFARLMGYLSEHGCLAVQMPLSWQARSHELMRETLANGGVDGAPLGTADLRDAMAQKMVGDARTYYDWLVNSAASLDIWETEYHHILDGTDAVLEWVRGTSLRPILQQLDDRELRQFLDTYRTRLREAYPTTPGGTLYPFRRLFIVVCK